MKINNKKFISILIGIIILGIVFGSGLVIGKKTAPQSITSDRIFFNKELGKPEAIDFSLFWDVLAKIEEQYVDSSKIDYQKILYGAVSGMVDSVGDDYTTFMPPEKAASFIKSVSGNDSFEGVGMELGIKDKILTVVAPIEGTPAFKAGIKSGDKILKIDDKTTEGMTTEEAVGLIRGPKGTSVTLTIIRKNMDSPTEIKLTRDVIEVPVIRWEMLEGDIAYVKIYQFTANLPSKFEDTVSQILNSNAKKIVIDLRNNPGGYLETAVDVASWFLPKDSVVVKEEFKTGLKNEYKSQGYKSLQNFQTIVLVNGGSASASEILAGALRDIKGIKLVGEKTFGKGSVQTMDSFRDDSSLKITVAKWFTPSGISIADEGLKPDVEVVPSDADITAGKDPQLDKAIELLNSK